MLTDKEKMYKKIIDDYLESLNGMDRVKADDLISMIKRSKNYIMKVNSKIKDGDVSAVKLYKNLCENIIECYNEMPEPPVGLVEKTGVETAMEILFGKFSS